jgi:transposase-like protein
MRMDDSAAFGIFQMIRFAMNDGNPFCPHCGVTKVYTLAETPMRWKCSACRKKFSITSGTIFHSRKLAIRDYLAVIALFCNDVKGTSALHMSRDMNINPKSAFVLLHKLHEAMGAEIAAGNELSGEVEVDGAYIGKGPKPANKKVDQEVAGARQALRDALQPLMHRAAGAHRGRQSPLHELCKRLQTVDPLLAQFLDMTGDRL